MKLTMEESEVEEFFLDGDQVCYFLFNHVRRVRYAHFLLSPTVEENRHIFRSKRTEVPTFLLRRARYN